MPRLYDSRSWRHRVGHVGKYVLPAGCLVPYVGVPAPREQVSIAALQRRFPDRVHALPIGTDQAEVATSIRVTDHGTASALALVDTAATPVVVYSVEGGSSVGRACCMVGPERTAIRETGFCLDRGFGRSLTFKQLDPRYWWQRHRGDLTARYRLRAPEHVSGRVVVLNNWQAHNYYHWLVEVAPRAAAIALAGVDVAGYLVDHRTTTQRHVLALLGIPDSRLIQPHAGLHLSADHMLWVSQPLGVLVRQFTGMITPHLDVDPAQKRRLYVSRRRAKHRRLVNERELEEALVTLGFEIACFEEMSFARQAALMSEAAVVVAVHGAALANAMFCRAGTRIIEIYPQRRGNIDLFAFWSRIHRLDHHVVMARCSALRQWLTVPVDDVLAAIAMPSLPAG